MQAQEELRSELETFGIQATEKQIQSLLQHLDLVIEKNKVLNLTRIDTVSTGITLHIVDSLLLLPAFQQSSGPFFDLGTGAGYPGIPLAIMSGQEGLLNDSLKKKIKAVDEFIAALDLEDQLQTSSERAEVLGKTKRSAFGCVTARAVAQLPTLVEYASPLLKQGGMFIATKGVLSDEEYTRGLTAAKRCGMELVERQHYLLPNEQGQREILSFEKVKNPSISLPRAVGKAKSSPLA